MLVKTHYQVELLSTFYIENYQKVTAEALFAAINILICHIPLIIIRQERKSTFTFYKQSDENGMKQ